LFLPINKFIQSEETTAPRVFLYPQMMHAKVVLTDGVIAAVGSAKLHEQIETISGHLVLIQYTNEIWQMEKLNRCC